MCPIEDNNLDNNYETIQKPISNIDAISTQGSWRSVPFLDRLLLIPGTTLEGNTNALL